MKKHITIFLVVLTLISACKKEDNTNNNNALPQPHFSVKWSKSYNYWLNLNINIHNLVATNDGGAAVFFSWFNDNDEGTCLLKTNANGTTEFFKEFSSADLGSSVASLIQTSDNGFLLYGNQTPPVFGKTDASGNLLWKKTMNYHQLTSVLSMIEKPTGGFLALAHSYSKVFLIDLDVQGDTNRCKLLIDSAQVAEGTQIEYNNNAGLIIAYSARINGDYVSFITSLDSNFNTNWSVPFALAGHGIVLRSFYINSNNSIMAAGDIFVNGVNAPLCYIASISASGSLNWAKQLASVPYIPLDIILAPNDGYYIVCDTDDKITKVNSSGDLLWRESLDTLSQLGPSGNTLKVSGNDILFFGNLMDFSALKFKPILIRFSEQ